MEDLKKIIRDIPDFPKKGIVFKDLTPLIGNPVAFKRAIDTIKHRYIGKHIDLVVGIEARGFIVGTALAYALNAGFVLIRKPGKLPYKTFSVEYELEYGTDKIEIHQDAIKKGQRILLTDDLLATGGTMKAAIELVNKMEPEIVELVFIVELGFLNGRQRLKGQDVFSLIRF